MRRLPALILVIMSGAATAAPPPSGPFDNGQCVDCHGDASPAVHSYATSKHGVLVRISTPGRAPDCVRCHTAQGHGASDAERLRQTCNHCHSPRYIETLHDNGARMVEIGSMKLLEAMQLLARARSEFPPGTLSEMEAHYTRMQRHQANLRLGVAHQSPDYQWWHGHPALDGDLLRLKGAYDRLVRQHATPQAR